MGKRLSLNIDINQIPSTYSKKWIVQENPIIYSDSMKRALDIFFSLLFILTVGWFILPLIALMVAIDSNGPVFFKQLRNGYKGKTFYCLKFRTMYYPCKQEFKQAKRNDSRITRVGKILRRTSLDELPQIFNILNGDMSLVGPRPHPIPLDQEYSQKLGSYLDRYHSKPGLTGLAQITVLLTIRLLSRADHMRFGKFPSCSWQHAKTALNVSGTGWITRKFIRPI